MRVFVPLLALAAVAPAQQIVVNHQTDNPRAGDLAYNRARESTFTGKVTGKLKADNVNGLPAPVRILVKVKNKSLNVDLGPTWYVRDQLASVNVGDKVTVTGSSFLINGQNVVNARIVRVHGNILALRDSGGYPYWVARRQKAPVEPSNGALAGRIVRMTTLNIAGQNFSGAMIDTGNGMRTVAFAPDWYYNQQDIQLQPGTYIRAYGNAYEPGPGVTSPAPGLYVVGGLYTPTTYYGFADPASGYFYGNYPGFPHFGG